MKSLRTAVTLCIKEAGINNIDVCFFYKEYRFVLGQKKSPGD